MVFAANAQNSGSQYAGPQVITDETAYPTDIYSGYTVSGNGGTTTLISMKLLVNPSMNVR